MPWYLFFFQAEDGIRDHFVTGVQTCALPIYQYRRDSARSVAWRRPQAESCDGAATLFPVAVRDWKRRRCGRDYTAAVALDRKSTRLNSSHTVISYAVFCLKKKKKKNYKEIAR